MRLRLNSPHVLKSYNPEDMMGWALVKVIDEDELIVEIDAHQTSAVEMPKVGQQWTISSVIRPKYLAGATIEIMELDPRTTYDYKVKMIKCLRPMPRNANFSSTFFVRRSHLASRA